MAAAVIATVLRLLAGAWRRVLVEQVDLDGIIDPHVEFILDMDHVPFE
jgi:hypothetical protein